MLSSLGLSEVPLQGYSLVQNVALFPPAEVPEKKLKKRSRKVPRPKCTKVFEHPVEKVQKNAANELELISVQYAVQKCEKYLQIR